MRSHFLWRIFPFSMVVTIVAVIAIALYAAFASTRLIEAQTRSELENTAQLLRLQFEPLVEHQDSIAIQHLCTVTGKASNKRITLVAPNGNVLGDSEEDPATMDNHVDREEIREAVTQGMGITTRVSHTTGRETLYVAIPIYSNNKLLGIIRAAMPKATLSGIMQPFDLRMAVDAAAIVCLAAIATIVLSRRIARPLEAIRVGAQRFCEGDLSYRLREQGPAEIVALARTMNQMAAELESHIARFTQLEGVRREFVANVSHELKTPVASIRGFAETLRDDPNIDPQHVRTYLEIIASQAGRLSTIIDDLLELSRLEQWGVEQRPFERERTKLKTVLAAAVEDCEPTSQERKATVELTCDSNIEVVVNPALLEQAVINLIDNALKYGPEGGTVQISGSETKTGIEITVKDHGPGIPTEHLPRIFERFYRVDRGRSRKLGGTGLGLSIVKHIVAAHHGTVTVESEFGRGSTFHIHLPPQA